MLASWLTTAHLAASGALCRRPEPVRVIAQADMAPKRKAATAVKAEKPAVKRTQAPKKTEENKSAAVDAASDGRKLSIIIEFW